jgi:hypothetical protein
MQSNTRKHSLWEQKLEAAAAPIQNLAQASSWGPTWTWAYVYESCGMLKGGGAKNPKHTKQKQQKNKVKTNKTHKQNKEGTRTSLGPELLKQGSPPGHPGHSGLRSGGAGVDLMRPSLWVRYKSVGRHQHHRSPKYKTQHSLSPRPISPEKLLDKSIMCKSQAHKLAGDTGNPNVWY